MSATIQLKGSEEVASRNAARRRSKQREQQWYLGLALATACGFLIFGAASVCYRSVWHQHSSPQPAIEAYITAVTLVLAAIGMEFYARWAHKALWHDFTPGWDVHKSHHTKRVGPFEANDMFSGMNAAPAIALCAYGFFAPGLVAAFCFGAGIGITIFGISYMFVHDGLVHKRFPTGSMGKIPFLRRVAAAHSLHHIDKFNGVPYGLFLGPQELARVGGTDDLNRQVERQIAIEKQRAASNSLALKAS
ncbi:hypothetical protein WJX74_002050 [Apatococcus lobatus]|uniref:beta-carotene 3-hydroxylase n=1 Tax=Apatococcus lobatus TaxID=904363 RepID=A0AAW1QV89_9CHLO